jgi:hypothetical protein
MILGIHSVDEAIVDDLERYERDKCCDEEDKLKFGDQMMPTNGQAQKDDNNLKPRTFIDENVCTYNHFRNIVYIKKSLDRNQVDDIFKEILQKQDQELPPDEIAGDWAKYKFKKNVLQK